MAYLAFLPTDEKGSVACNLEFLSWKRSIFKYSTKDWFWSVTILIVIQLLYHGQRSCGSTGVRDISMYVVIFSFTVCFSLSFPGVLAFISRHLLKSKPFFLKQSVPSLLLYQQELTFVPAIHFLGKADKNLHLQKEAHLPANRVLAECLIR